MKKKIEEYKLLYYWAREGKTSAARRLTVVKSELMRMKQSERHIKFNYEPEVKTVRMRSRVVAKINQPSIPLPKNFSQCYQCDVVRSDDDMEFVRFSSGAYLCCLTCIRRYHYTIK